MDKMREGRDKGVKGGRNKEGIGERKEGVREVEYTL